MQLKTAAKLAIACLSVSALMTLTRDIWTHWVIVRGTFTDMRALSLVVVAIEVLLIHVPLIIFFVVLSRKRIDDLQKTKGHSN
ncbi:MAG: hypothetical protein ACR2LM_04285 [Pyrinomonadaceae bacterium]